MVKKPDPRIVVRSVLAEYGETFAEEIGIDLEANSPASLFQLLCAALLYSARIAASSATSTARALCKAGLGSPERMAAASWQDRVDVLTSNGYKRFDEKTSTQLGDAAQLVLDIYDGDLRQLRQRADMDVKEERRLLQEVKGIGRVGADIFLREVQGVWPEVFPYADHKVTAAAKRLGLPGRAGALSRLVPREEFPRLVAALTRVSLADAFDEIRATAIHNGAAPLSATS